MNVTNHNNNINIKKKKKIKFIHLIELPMMHEKMKWKKIWVK